MSEACLEATNRDLQQTVSTLQQTVRDMQMTIAQLQTENIELKKTQLPPRNVETGNLHGRTLPERNRFVNP